MTNRVPRHLWQATRWNAGLCRKKGCLNSVTKFRFCASCRRARAKVHPQIGHRLTSEESRAMNTRRWDRVRAGRA